LSTVPLCDDLGRAAGFASFGEDVTELRGLRVDAARRESEEEFRKMADSAPLMIWEAEANGGCIFANSGWCAFTGSALAEQLGGGWLSVVHPDDRKHVIEAYTDAFQARRSFQLETRVRCADGEYRWILSSATPRFTPDGRLAGYIGSCTDITQLKRSREETLARQKLETVGRLAGGIAHDFNNLLGGVLAQAELALTELAAGEAPVEALTNVRAVAVRGGDIVRQLLIYSGQDNASPEPIDLSALVKDMRELLRVVVSKHAILKAELADRLPLIRANVAQLRQVVMNLVTNGSEAIGDRDGVITIRTAAAPGSRVLLEVVDTGGGIPNELQSKLFDPFFTTKSTGHGLGLAVVQSIVQGIRGEIRFETEPGRGTAFRILLPAAEAIDGGAADGESPGPLERAEPAGRVLVVEDEDMLRNAVSRMLRLKGVEVLEAADGDAALQIIRESAQPIATLLLDITLPGAPSRLVFAEARRLHPETRVILTSAYSEATLDESFPGMRFDAFIRKPYPLSRLLDLLLSLAPAGACAAAPPQSRVRFSGRSSDPLRLEARTRISKAPRD
jgi:PAS domain S-box-containing protein